MFVSSAYSAHIQKQFNTYSFYCHFARFLWRAVQVSFNFDIPTSVEHLFSDWVNSVGNRFKKIILVGAATLC
jgi:hypothetical protein